MEPGLPATASSAPPSGEPADVDIVTDIFQRILPHLRDAPANLAHDVERGVRRDWGGERPYIAKEGESGKRERSARDEQIRADFRRGEREPYLARKFQISIRRIRQILKLGNALP